MMRLLKFLSILLLIPQVCFASASRDWDGANDIAETNTAETTPTTISIMAHINPDNEGEGGFGRVVVYDNTGTGAAPTSGLAVDGTTGSCSGTNLGFSMRSDWSTTDGTWNSSCGSLVDDSWYSIAASYNGSSNTNDPTLYINGISTSIAVEVNGSGTLVTAANEVLVGNTDDTARTFDGQINFVQIWNRSISAVEMAEAHFRPGLIADGLIHFYSIWGDTSEKDLGTRANDLAVTEAAVSSSGSPHVFFGNGLPL